MKKHYYLVKGTTIYDGLGFGFNYVCERNYELTQKEAEKDVLEYQCHEDSGEELESIDFLELSKKEYDIMHRLIDGFLLSKEEADKWYRKNCQKK